MSAWDDPGAEQVAPGVHRLPLPLPGDALRAVNVYVLETPDGLVLVDAGWDTADARAALERGLAEVGAGLGDVRRFLVTHAHRDHYTLATTVRRELGTAIALGARERPSVELIAAGTHLGLGPQLALLDVLAPDMSAQLRALAGDVVVDPRQWEEPDTWLEPGELPLPGGRVLEVVETPGHTRGHVVFADDAGGLLFAGDHVLPTITPSIGFEAALQDDPLGAFLDSLALVRARPDAVLLPAHGPVAPSVHARIDELLDHHGRRLDQAAALAAGGATVLEVAQRLRWTRRERAFDELDLFNGMLAVFETKAHLDLLVAQGRLEHPPGAPAFTYA